MNQQTYIRNAENIIQKPTGRFDMVKAEIFNRGAVLCFTKGIAHFSLNLTRRPIYLVCKTSRKVTVRLYLAITMEYT